MDINVRNVDAVTVVECQGPMTIADSEQLRRLFRQRLDAGDRQFVVNTTDAPFIDSASVGEIVACLKRAREAGGQLKVVAMPGGKVERTLQMTTLDRLFELFDDEDKAVVSFVP